MSDTTEERPTVSSERQLADLAMVLDLAGELTGLSTESEQVERIFHIFTTICGPSAMSYLALDGNLAGRIIRHPAQEKDFPDVEPGAASALSARASDLCQAVSGDGFLFSVYKGDEPISLIEIEGVTSPELIDHYVNMALNIRGMLGLAITNARLYQRELDSRVEIQGYADQLAILHEIGLSLNRETDTKRLLGIVLKGAVELTASAGGLLSLGAGAATQAYGNFTGTGSGIDDDRKAILDEIAACVARSDLDVLRVAATVSGGEGLVSLSGTPAHDELLVGVLRDSRGGNRGYFAVECGAGARFSVDDEAVIGLLAAQASVALASAENFEREHLVAEVLLDALLPSVPERRDLDFGLLYRSAGQHRIGGDFYEFIEIGPRLLAVAIGDVCGKGLQAATFNAMVKYMLKAFISEKQDPGSCLARLNRVLVEELPHDRFVTMGLALIDTGASSVEYASAGHPVPIISSGDSVRELELPATGLPLGVMDDTRFPTVAAAFSPGSMMLFYTDGIIETRSAEGSQFGCDRLRDVVTESLAMPTQAMAEDLMSAVVGFSHRDLKDDAALVIVRHRG